MSLLTNLVSYWKLDGDVLDVHGANDGTPTAITYGTGVINQGAQGNGTSSVINLGTANLNLTGNFSFACWVKPVNTQVIYLFTRCVANGGSSSTYEVRISNNALELCGPGGVYIQGGSVPAGVWSHVACTRVAAGGQCRLFVNGAIVNTLPTSTVSTSLPAQATLIGGRDDNNTFFNCLIDEVGVWDRVLSTVEVGYLSNGSIGIPYPLTEEGIGNFDYHDSERYDFTTGAKNFDPIFLDIEKYDIPFNEIERGMATFYYIGGCPDPVPVPVPPDPVNDPPTVYSVRPLSPTLIEVIFSEDVVMAEALNVGNYSMTGGVSIRSAINVGGTLNVYRLTVSTMEPSTAYTLTVSNIHDLAGSSI